MSGEQKLKEGDEIIHTEECSNKDELLFFTNKCQVYKAKVNDFDDTKASVLGDYAPGKLEMDADENVVYVTIFSEYIGYMMFVFENGKVAKVDMSAYETKTNRKKLLKAYSAKSPLAAITYLKEDTEYVIKSTSGRMLILNTASLTPKSTKDTMGVSVMTLKKKYKVESIHLYKEGEFEKAWRYRTKNLPAAGALPSAADIGEQLTF